MYRSVLHLNLKLETFHFDLIFSPFWLESMFYEKGSVKVVSFFLFQTLLLRSSRTYCKNEPEISQNLKKKDTEDILLKNLKEKLK